MTMVRSTIAIAYLLSRQQPHFTIACGSTVMLNNLWCERRSILFKKADLHGPEHVFCHIAFMLSFHCVKEPRAALSYVKRKLSLILRCGCF